MGLQRRNHSTEWSAIQKLVSNYSQGTTKADVSKNAFKVIKGAEACIRQVRDVIFWPGIAADIKEMVSHCEVCSKFICTQQREPLMAYCPGPLHLQRKRLP